MTDALITDEIRHIRYTANYIERAVHAGYRSYVLDAMADFQAALNFNTLDELQAWRRVPLSTKNTFCAKSLQ